MALTDPLQWVVIAVVVIVFLMYGPKKIPELARSIGLARKEFSEASKQPINSGTTDVVPSAPVATVAPPATSATGDALLNTAKALGINTEGKTRDEISSEIVARAQKN